MNPVLRLAVIAFSAATISGCDAFDTGQERAEVILLSGDQPTVISYTGSVRGAYVVPNTSNSPDVKYCAEPPPDVAVNTLRDLKAKAEGEVSGQGKASAELQNKIENTVVALEGRSETILLTRELLYRLCELNANKVISDAAAVDIFKSIARATADLAEAERDRANARVMDVSQGALRAEAAEEVAINAILKCLVKPDDSVDQAVLGKLLVESPVASGFANSLKNKKTGSALSRYLDGFVSDEAKAELSKATQTVECVRQT